MVKLPELEFNLPEWPTHSFDLIRSSVQKVKTIGQSAGAGSDKFKRACSKIKAAFQQNTHIDYTALFRERVDVRAISYLLSSDKRFAYELVLDRELLEQLALISNPLSKLSLIQLIRAYFVHFDRLTDDKGLEYWSFFINKQLLAIDTQSGSSELQQYAKHRDWIFSQTGPVKLAKNAQAEQVDFDIYIKRLGLGGYADGRYLTLARYQYYLQTLNSLPVGQDCDLLTELVKPDVFNAPHEDNKLLGHAILETMIDRSSGQQLSDSWQRVILSIAGDPRVPKSSPKYQKWWAILGEKRIALVRGWLSRFDLSLFLKVLEQSAKDGNNADMERMFQPRKAFMDGLEKSGVITESRLFLSNYAERYLKSHYKPEELPSYAKVASQQTSMIYLNIDNKVHMIEGSHSFKLKLMRNLPKQCEVANYDCNVIGDRDLRVTLARQYVNEFGNEGFLELIHSSGWGWQNKAINFLRKLNIDVTASDVILKDEYRRYKRRHGAD